MKKLQHTLNFEIDYIRSGAMKTARPVAPPPKQHKAPRNIPTLPTIPNTNPRFKSARVSHLPPDTGISPIVTNGPIGPKETIERYGALLIPYERTEVYKFPEIYFVGKRQSKVPLIKFDDAEKHYRISTGDHLAYRYEIVRKFGAGAFGQVVQAYDHKIKKMVAVKILVNTKQMHEQGQIEAKILAHLNERRVPNVVEAYDMFVFRSHICITFEVLGKSLYNLLEQNSFHPMNLRVVRAYAVQMFTALAVIASMNISHCDVKPENVLIGEEGHVKLIDFGSSCFVNEQIYEYIQSRYYRAPEVILGIDYGPPMDVWSAALVIIELLTGKPLFPGTCELEQLYLFSEYIGLPPRGLVKSGRRRSEFFTGTLRLKKHKKTFKKPGSLRLYDLLAGVNDPYLCDFLQKCLTWDQKLRMTAAQALHHPFLQMKQITLRERVFTESLPVLNLRMTD